MMQSSERQDHFALIEWANHIPLLRKYLIHVPNEYDGGSIKGKIRKRMGVRKGVSDFFFPISNSQNYPGLWLEMKSKKGKPTEEQVEWLSDMAKAGYACSLVYGLDQAITVLTQYLNGKFGN